MLQTFVQFGLRWFIYYHIITYVTTQYVANRDVFHVPPEQRMKVLAIQMVPIALIVIPYEILIWHCRRKPRTS